MKIEKEKRKLKTMLSWKILVRNNFFKASK